MRDLFANQFVGGGLTLMLTGAALALLRNIPARLWRFTRRRLTVTIEILNSDPLFDYVGRWLDQQCYSRRTTLLTANTYENRELKRQLVFTPAPGHHLFWRLGFPVWIYRERDKENSIGAGGNTAPGGASLWRKHEAYTLTTLRRNRGALESLLNEAITEGMRPPSGIKLHQATWGYWRVSRIIQPRTLDSVVLPHGVSERLLADTRSFLESVDWYRRVGIPWHRGYLLHGVPGSGKTSLVTALAGELGMDLYLLNIAGFGMDDERLGSLMKDVDARSIVLIEDVDCTVPSREQVSTSNARQVTLSGLLNCLDGVASREGCLIFMTTNRRERLDAALLRPGRVDVSLEFTLATSDQIERMRQRLVPTLPMAAAQQACKDCTMAEVQQWLLEKRREEAAA